MRKTKAFTISFQNKKTSRKLTKKHYKRKSARCGGFGIIRSYPLLRVIGIRNANGDIVSKISAKEEKVGGENTENTDNKEIDETDVKINIEDDTEKDVIIIDETNAEVDIKDFKKSYGIYLFNKYKPDFLTKTEEQKNDQTEYKKNGIKYLYYKEYHKNGKFERLSNILNGGYEIPIGINFENSNEYYTNIIKLCQNLGILQTEEQNNEIRIKQQKIKHDAKKEKKRKMLD